MIDSIEICGFQPLGTIDAFSSYDSCLSIASGTQVDLDYNGILRVGDLYIDGVRYAGGRYGALTHPAVFRGSGLLKTKPSGTLLFLR